MLRRSLVLSRAVFPSFSRQTSKSSKILLRYLSVGADEAQKPGGDPLPLAKPLAGQAFGDPTKPFVIFQSEKKVCGALLASRGFSTLLVTRDGPVLCWRRAAFCFPSA